MKKGFTLIELLAVIALLATLMVFVVPNVLKTLSNSKTSLSSIQKKQLKEAVELYIRDTCIDPIEDTTCTLEAKTATNLITNGGFEDGTTGWTLPNSNSNASITTDNKNSGSKSLKISMTTGTISVNCSSPVQAVREHIVYASVYKYIPFYSAGYSLFEFYNGSEYALVSGTGYEANLNHNQSINSWTFYSLRGTVRNYNSISICARMGCGGTCSITEYYDDLLLIDLTATFGAGSEPSKEWCNKNLQYPILPKVFYNGELSLSTFANKGYINSKEIENNCTGNINIINNEINLDNITCQF